MVRSGAYSYVNYGYEPTFAGGATANKSFGLQTRVTGWTLTHNRIDLNSLGQVEPKTFAYGQQSGTLGVGFVLSTDSTPALFQSIYGSAGAVGSLPTTYTYPSGGLGEGNAPKDVIGNSITVEIGFQADGGNIVRTLKGGVVNSLGISASVGDIVNCTADISYGDEDNPTTSFGSQASSTGDEPYTFAHGVLKYGGNTIVQLQDADISFTQNTELLYGLGSHQAVDAIKKVLEITGRFRASWLNTNIYQDMLDQISKGSAGTYGETVGGTPEFELTFNNGKTGASLREIKITGSGLAPSDHAISGIEPVEPVFEEINWKIKSAKIEAKY